MSKYVVEKEYIALHYRKYSRKEMAIRLHISSWIVGILYKKLYKTNPDIEKYEAEKVKVLAKNGYNVNRIRKETGIPVSFICNNYPNLKLESNRTINIHEFIKQKCKECKTKIIGVTVSCLDDLQSLNTLEEDGVIKKEVLESGLIKIELIGG